MSESEFLDSVSNRHTKKEYRYGIKKFCDWFNKTPKETLEMRKDDLTPRQEENIIEQKNRAKRFEKEIERFHSYLIEQGYAINSARTLTLGIRQLFRYYEMRVQMRTGSKVSKTVKTSKSFPLRIENIRSMFNIADLRERVLLSVATDLALRISDFRNIKRTDLPDLNTEPPIPFDVMTGKEDVVAHGYLSAEAVELLKVYLKTIKEKENPYLFPSNGKKPISDDRINSWLRSLAKKAGIKIQGKRLTFHCFRKMFLSTSIDSGIGLTAGKMMCGKAIAKSDDTYLTTVQLREKFIQLKKLLMIKQTVQPEKHEIIEELSKAVTKLHEDVNAYKTIAETITEKNRALEEQITEIQKIDHETMKEIEKLKQVYQQGIQELEIEMNKERTRVSHLSKMIQPLIKRQMTKLGQKVGEEIKQTQT